MAGEVQRADTVAIIGLGLIGGSLARALRAAGFCRRLLGYGHREPSLRRGVELGVIDEFTLELDEALREADLLVICTPTLVAAELLARMVPRIDAGDRAPVVTDAASVKGSLVAAARAAAGGRELSWLVPGHPIAGSERSGVEASTAELYRDHRVILTPLAETDAAALELVRDMWLATGAEVVEMDLDRHDRVLAATSHLPHLLAYALVDALAASPDGPDIFRFAAGGFRDFTRIASSDPVMWRDIALANRDALLLALDGFERHLAGLRAAVAAQDGAALEATFGRAKAARDGFAAELARRARGSGPSGESGG